jgi:hypothetical protein
MSKKQRRLERIEANTKRIESTGFKLNWFSDIHVRIDNRVDFWVSTSNWHIKGKKKEGKTFDEMISYLKGEVVKEPHTPEEKKIGELLIEAWSLMLKLKSTHPDHCRDFADGIHKCQDVLIHRVIQRDYPETYPIK